MASMAKVRTSGSQTSSASSSQRRPSRAASASTHRHQVIPRIEPLGNRADLLAAGLAVAGVDGAGQRVDLGAGVVHVVFPRHREAHVLEQVGERIADHGAPRVPDVERPGGVGRDVLDVDRPALPQVLGAVAGPRGEKLGQARAPELVGKPEIDEAGSGHLDRPDLRPSLEPGRQAVCDLARLAARLPGEHERCIAGGVAVRRLARRLHRDRPEVESGGQHSGTGKALNFPLNNLKQITENVHLHSTVSKRLRCSWMAKRSVIPAT